MTKFEYAIDPELMRRTNVSGALVLWGRLCEAARVQLGDRDRLASLDLEDVLRLAVIHCGEDSSFIPATLPLKEAVFRLLLVAPEQWIPGEQLHSTLSGLWARSPRPRRLSWSVFERVLRTAQPDGIVNRPG